MSKRVRVWGLAVCLLAVAPQAQAGPPTDFGGVGSHVFVVLRASGALAVYDWVHDVLLSKRIEGLGDLHHATMVFTPDLRWGFVASRSGQVSRVDLETLELKGIVQSSASSIDNAISPDGRLLAVGEYAPGGVTLIDTETLEVVRKFEAFKVTGKASRATGIVDAPGNRFVAVLMETPEVWIIDADVSALRITHRIPLKRPQPYDAMITPDGRWYVVGHLNSDDVSVVDLDHPERGARVVSLRGAAKGPRTMPVKLPHLAAWAVAGDVAFVPLVGRGALAVLSLRDWTLQGAVPLRGNPVYAVVSPTGREIWVSFSGEHDDSWVQVVDVASRKVVASFEVGKRIYHMDFTPRGATVLISANGANKLFEVDAHTHKVVRSVSLPSPSGVFGPWRAFRLGL